MQNKKDIISVIENGLLTAPTYMIGQPKRQASLFDRMQHYNIPGVSLAVINDSALDWAKGYGVANVSNASLVTPDTRFYAASISKPIAAMAALSLVDAGLLDLDEEVNHQLTTWRISENDYTRIEKVTLRRLLSHSAGLDAGPYWGYAAEETVPTLLQLLNGQPPSNSGPVEVTFVPGSQFAYSGAGYWVLQQLLEDVTNMPFAMFVHQAVFEKLAMQHSTFYQPLPPTYAQVAATGHDALGQPSEERWSRHPGLPDGGLWTTPTDLARFLIELQLASKGQSNKVLSKALTQAMLTEQIENHTLGMHVFGEGNTTRISHGGEGESFRCLMTAFGGTGQGAVVMVNSANGDSLIAEIFRSLAEVYAWPDYRPMGYQLANVNPSLYPAYVGQYQFLDDRQRYGDYTGQWQVNEMPAALFTVRCNAAGLLIRDPVGTEWRYYPQSPTTFFALESEYAIKFCMDANHQASQIEIVCKHTTFKAHRINP